MAAGAPLIPREQLIQFHDKGNRVVTLDRKARFLMLSLGTVDKPSIDGLKVPKTFRNGELHFIAKDELHITLAGPKLVSEVFESRGDSACSTLSAIIARHDFNFEIVPDSLKIISEGKNKSIITLARCPNSLLFYSELSAAFLSSRTVLHPSLHVTLMVEARSFKKGIAVPSFHRLAQLNPIRLPSLE
jgi:hypothetical protein